MSDISDELERHIRDCGRLMQAAYAKWNAYGDFADHGEADHWRMAMEEAIKSRSPAQVAKLERERGLA